MSEDSLARVNPWAAGIAVFAGASLLIIGMTQLIQGFAVAMNNDLFVLTAKYAFAFNPVTWGWMHIVFGILAMIVGCGVLVGQRWAIIGGLVVAILLIGVNFAWLPFQPVWAVLLIAFSGAATWALSSVLAAERRPRQQG